MSHLLQDRSVDLHHTIETVIEGIPESIKEIFPILLLRRFQKTGAKSRSQRQRDKSGNQDGDSDGESKLFVQDTHDPAKESDRYEDRSQNDRYADNRALYLLHRSDSRLFRAKVVIAHFIFDGFDDDDRIIDDKADSQDHCEKRQGIDGESEKQEGSKGTQERYRHRDHRDERGSPVLQENVHDQCYDEERFDEGMHDLFDGGIDEVRIIHADDIAHVIGEALRIFFQLFLDRTQSFECIRIIGQREGEDRRPLSRRTGNEAVVLCPQLDTGNILQAKHGAVIIGTKYDIAEFLLRHKTALRRDDVLEGGIRIDRSTGNVTGRDLLILRRNGRNDLARSDLVLRHLRRIHPDAHRKVRAKFLYVADALDGLQLIQVVHGEIVFQEDVIIRAIR